MRTDKKELCLSDFPFPSSTEMETTVIADIVANPEELHEARRIITAASFSDERCRNAWSTLCKMQDKGERIDLVSASERLERDFLVKTIIPLTSQSACLATITHCQMLAAKAIQARAYKFALKMLQVSTDKTASLDELVSLPERFASAVRADLNADADSIPLTDAINILADTIQHEQEERTKGRPTRVPTGIGTLDWLTYGGFGPGQLVILAARPSVGKTAIALSMARAATSAGVPATIFSLEMTNQELAQRLLLSTGKIQAQQIASGQMEWADFDSAAGRFDKFPLYLNDSARTIDDIAARIILNHQHRRCNIAFVDYLGLIDTRTEGNKPLYQIIAGITKRLKQTAKDCRIPIVLLCQLNRASASDNRSPQLFDLRDSGSIEQDADIVLMLERITATDETINDDARLNMWVRKNRQGKAGDIFIELQPDSTYTTFKDLGAKRP